MWNLKFKVLNKDSIYTILTNKYNVTDYLYPVDNYKKGNKVYILGIHHLDGEENEIKKFISELSRNKKVKEIEINGKEVITLIAEEESFYQLLFAAELYHTSPVLIKEGYEEWNISSFDRSLLEKLIKEIEKWKDKFSDFKLKSLAKTKHDEIYFPKIRPNLPEKQRLAFDLALKRGYYLFPRKVNLGNLAKEMKVSTATLHENLRKAESKLLPFFSA
jgi:predicted DNA binding protein